MPGPIYPPASEELAERYYAIHLENPDIGIPWDLALLIDALLAEKAGKADIDEDINPLDTIFELLTLKEDIHRWDNEREEWVYFTTNYYDGKHDMLEYASTELFKEINQKYNIGKDPTKDFTVQENINIPNIIRHAEIVAHDLSNELQRHTVRMTVIQDIESVLKNKFKFNAEEIDKIMQLYDSKYLWYIYGFSEEDPGE